MTVAGGTSVSGGATVATCAISAGVTLGANVGVSTCPAFVGVIDANTEIGIGVVVTVGDAGCMVGSTVEGTAVLGVSVAVFNNASAALLFTICTVGSVSGA